MPLKRTPPPATPPTDKKSKNKNASEVVLSPEDIGVSSTTHLSSLDRDNVTLRRKCADASSMDFFMKEMKGLFAKSSEQYNSKFSLIQNTMKEILSQNKEIKESMEMISKQYDEMKIKFDSLEKQRKDDRLYISQLEEKIYTLEHSQTMSKFEIRNIPKGTVETKENLCEIVLKTANVLEVPLEQHEIKDVFRTKNKTGAGNIIVDLSTTIKKEKMIKNVRKFNIKNSANKLNTSHLSLGGPQKPVFVAEYLTLKGRHLNYLARTFAQEHGYKFCWTSFGRTYLREKEGKPYIRIDSESDLTNLRIQI
ncbi:hypothetical protein ACJJTC_013525 [Scirpophaga incertulas]